MSSPTARFSLCSEPNTTDDSDMAGAASRTWAESQESSPGLAQQSDSSCGQATQAQLSHKQEVGQAPSP